MGSLAEWRRGWRTVASSFVGVIFMAAVPAVTGVVMAPLTAEFGWSRSIIAANVFICSVMTLVLAPSAGRLIARFGPRRCALAAITAAIPALLLIALTGGSPLTWLGAWFIYAVINLGISPIIWSGAVAGLFDRARGMALAVTLSGAGLAYFVFPPLAVAVLTEFGWRGVYVTLAVLFLVVLLPLCYAWFRSASDLPDTTRSGEQPVGPVTAVGFALGEALRMRQFWQFAGVAALMAIAEGALQVHFFPILQEGGLSAGEAAWVASMMGIAMVVGRILAGYMQDKLPPLPVFGCSILFVLASCLLLRYSTGDTLMGTAVSICLGLGAGGTTIGLAYLASRYFGLLAYPSIYGLLMGGFSLGYGAAPVVAGHLREVSGSYVPIFNWLAAILAVAAALTWLLGPSKLRPTS